MIAILTRQLLLMMLLCLVGYLLFRSGRIGSDGSKTIGTLLLYLSLPCVIVQGFFRQATSESVRGLALSTLFSLLCLLCSIILSRMLFRRDPIEAFGAAFSNPGFFGIPLIAASLSENAVFYLAPFIAFLNLLQWSYGVWLLTKDKKEQEKAPTEKSNIGNSVFSIAKRLLTAPFMIAVFAGLFFFFTGVPVPDLLRRSIGYIAGLNTPLAMFAIGIYLAQADLLRMFAKPRLYLVAFVRMLLIPSAVILLLMLLPESYQELRLALLIASACPVGSNIAVYAQLYDCNDTYAVETIVVSSLFFIATLPAITALADLIWAFQV